MTDVQVFRKAKYHVRRHSQVYTEIDLPNGKHLFGLTDTKTTVIGTTQKSLEVQNHKTILALMD